MLTNTYVGLSGLAGSGKDLFYSLLSQRVPCVRLSLADPLKEEVLRFSFENYGIDPLTCSREEKNMIRPFLVFHGSMKRKETSGRYWIDKINNKIIKNKITNSIVVITDIRYDDYEKDETFWLKNELRGVLVHITLLEERAGVLSPIPAINKEEERNDPKIKDKADFKITWPRLKNLSPSASDIYVNEFISWLSARKDRPATCEKTQEQAVRGQLP